MSGVFSSQSTYQENVKFDPTSPPIFDEYDHEEAWYFIEIKDLLNFRMVDFKIEEHDRSVEKLFFQVEFVIKTIHNNLADRELSRLVHGGRRGGRHELIWEKMDKLEGCIEDDELKKRTMIFTNNFMFFVNFASEFTRIVFDPGGFHGSKNRDDSFEEREYDTK